MRVFGEVILGARAESQVSPGTQLASLARVELLGIALRTRSPDRPFGDHSVHCRVTLPFRWLDKLCYIYIYICRYLHVDVCQCLRVMNLGKRPGFDCTAPQEKLGSPKPTPVHAFARGKFTAT